MSRAARLFVALVALASCPLAAFAAWIPGGLDIGGGVGAQDSPFAVADGAGGAYVLWRDVDRAGDLYLQHVDPEGVLHSAWPTGGLRLCAGPMSRVPLGAFPDGAGGIVVLWREGAEFRAQRRSLAGLASGWSPDGNLVALSPDSGSVIGTIGVAGDGMGGAWLAYRRGGVSCTPGCTEFGAIDAQYIPPDGSPGPPAIVLQTSTSAFSATGFVREGEPGQMLSFTTGGSSAEGSLRRVDAPAAPVWQHTGPSALGGTIALAADDAGGAYQIRWFGSTTPTPGRIDARRIGPDGALVPGWAPDGVPLRSSTTSPGTPVVVADGAEGVIVAWTEPGDLGTRIRVQRLHPDGARWAADGVTLCDTTGSRGTLRLAADGSGGAFVAWRDFRDDNLGNVHASRVRAGGDVDPAFVPQGSVIGDALGEQFVGSLTCTSPGVAVVTWVDWRMGSAERDVYVQQLPLPRSAVGAPSAGRAGAASFAGFAPHPATADPHVAFSLARASHVRLDVFDPQGRRVAAHDYGRLAAGRHRRRAAPDDALGAGIYLLRLSVDGTPLVRRGLVLP